jgi:hypothetical protein
MSGANTLAAADKYSFKFQAFTANGESRYGASFLLTSLNAGSTTFKMKYRVQTGGGGAGTGTFADRQISVVTL